MLELPSKRFPERFADALQAWERRNGLVGKRGTRRALAGAMSRLFADAAPTETAISPWLSQSSTPGIDNAYMLAVALGVRPEWLMLNSGPMAMSTVTQDPHGRPLRGDVADRRQRREDAG
jgi:hypothetical protein